MSRRSRYALQRYVCSVCHKQTLLAPDVGLAAQLGWKILHPVLCPTCNPDAPKKAAP